LAAENLIVSDRLETAPLQEESRAATIFIVDDEPMVGEVVSVVLGIEGFNTRLFTSPLDALEAFESAERKPDLLISDFAMQPFDGLDLIVRCRQIVPNLRTLLYSGNSDAHEIQQHGVRADDFLNKPFLPKELIQKVRALVQR
jgi:DNA-binding response OmpR family regulator